jgi:hypothetical protein
MDEKLKKQFADYFKTSEEEVEKAYKEIYEFVNTQFKNATEEVKNNKILNSLRAKFMPTFGANTKTYKGIAISVSEQQDAHRFQRFSQLKVYNDTKKQAEEQGDITILEDLYGKVVSVQMKKTENGLEVAKDANGEPILNYDKNGNVIPLFPYYKKDGNKSAMAGKELPAIEDSMIRVVEGICYQEGKKPEEDLKTFVLKLSGKAIDNIPPFGKIISFKCGGKEWNDTYQLNSGVTDFVETEDDYLQQGINSVGIEGIVEKYYEDNILTYDIIEKAKQDFVENPNENPIPQELRYFCIIPDNNCMSQNFVPNDKDKCSMTFCSNKFSLNNTVTIVSGVEPEIANNVEFGPNSTCTIVGRLSIFGKEGDEPMVYFTMSGAIGKKGEIVERIEAEPLQPEEETTTSSEPVKEAEVKKVW